MFEFQSLKELKRKKISYARFDSIEPQEIFLDNLAKNRQSQLGVSEKKFEVVLPDRILKIFRFFAMLIFTLLIAKAFQYQVIDYKDLLAKAKENKFINQSLEASRGVVYDSKNEQLVFNIPSFDLAVDKSALPKDSSQKENVVKIVADIIGVSTSDLEKKINNSKDQFFLVKENLGHQPLVLLSAKSDQIPGFEIKRNSVRSYKDSQYFSHLLGYMGRVNSDELKNSNGMYAPFDFAGRDGLEKSYEEYLRRNPGKLQIEKDAFGNVKSKKVVESPESGNSLVLWVDSKLQEKISQELQKTLDNLGGKKAAAVAIDPRTGGVLALVSLPGYDNNAFAQSSDPAKIKIIFQNPLQPMYDRAIAGTYASGSIIKPLEASGALEENLIPPDKTILTPPQISIINKYDPSISYIFRDWTNHVSSDMRKAIAESNNIYFYTIGGGYGTQQGLGPSRIKKYLDLFGWSAKTNIDIPGENSGFVPSPEWKKETKKESWWDGDTYNLSIGQGDLKVTPLEVAMAYSSIANNGTLYKPQIVRKVIDSDKKVIKTFEPEIVRQNFIDSQNLQIVREGMRLGVTGENAPHASSVILKNLPVAAAAKTGTAQTSTPNHYHNWITVFAPYDNPQIVLTIMLENVPTQAAAIPPAKNILDWYFTQDAKK